jgi:hypothetical protein
MDQCPYSGFQGFSQQAEITAFAKYPLSVPDLETSMKVKLNIRKDGTPLYAAIYDIADAESFGKACADVWWKLRQQQLDKEPSIGALLEHLDENVLSRLNGAQISLEPV